MEKELILEKISEQLDLLVSLSKIAYAEKINQVKEKISSEETMSKMLEIIENEENLPAGKLVKVVEEQVKLKERTIRIRLSQLVSLGVLKIERVGNNSFYRSTGLN